MLKTGKWKFYKKTSHNTIPCRLTNKFIHNFLVENDYISKSTASADKILSKIPEHLKHYWWRGYFDGDGCFCKSNRSYIFTISSNIDQNWNFIDTLFNNLDIFYKIKFVIRKTRNSRNSTFKFVVKKILLSLGIIFIKIMKMIELD